MTYSLEILLRGLHARADREQWTPERRAAAVARLLSTN